MARSSPHGIWGLTTRYQIIASADVLYSESCLSRMHFTSMSNSAAHSLGSRGSGRTAWTCLLPPMQGDTSVLELHEPVTVRESVFRELSAAECTHVQACAGCGCKTCQRPGRDKKIITTMTMKMRC